MSNRKKVVNGLANKSGTQARETKTERNHTKWNDDIFLLHPYFEVIVEGEGQYRFNCKLCQTNQSRFHSGWREGLKDHLMTKAHAEFTPLEEKEHLNECIRLLGGEVRPVQDDTHLPQIENPLSREKERELYFKLAQFIIKHHLPFSISEDLVDLIQKINSSTDSSLLQRAHLSSTTVSRMTRECIGSTLKAQIFDELKQSYFSILTDVASDLFGGNYIGLLVRYIKEDVDMPVTRLLSVIEVGTESTGQSLYTKITQELFSNDLGLEGKLIGVCTDNESKMISIKDKGLSNRLKDRIPYLVHVRDVCHGYNLACKAGLKEIPARFVSFVTKISAHFGKSVLRKARLRAIQSSHNQDPLDVHRFVPVRWLSLHQCCDRVLQLWPYLKEYFDETDCSLKEKFTKEYYIYTKLLSCLLGKLNHYNIYFQKDSLVSSQVLEKIQEGFTMFAQMLLTREGQRLTFEDIYARTDELIQIEANDMIDPIEEFKANFLARYPEFTRLIEEGQNELSPDFRKTFFSSAQGFVRNAIRVMREKLPFENEILSMAEDIYLEKKDFQIATWRSLAASFPNIITPDRAIDYEEEIQRLNFRYKKIRERHESSQSTILKTWNLLAQDYPNVALLAKAMLVLPYTTSCVESTFSKFKVLKTPYRNRLSAESLEACILTEQAFAKEEPEILPQMLIKYQNMWRPNNTEEQIDATIIDPSVIDLPEIIASEQASQRLPDSDTDNLDDEIQTIVYTKQAGTTKRSANLVRNVSGEKKVKKNNPG